MSTIDVDIAESRTANSRLSPIRSSIGDVAGRLIHLQSTIDPRILNQNNLRTRINNARSDADSIEMELQRLQTSITEILDNYVQTDLDLSSRAPLGDGK